MTDLPKQLKEAVNSGAAIHEINKAYRTAIAKLLTNQSSFGEVFKLCLSWGSLQENCGVLFEGLTDEQTATAYDTCYKQLAKALIALLKKEPSFRQTGPFLGAMAAMKRFDPGEVLGEIIEERPPKVEIIPVAGRQPVDEWIGPPGKQGQDEQMHIVIPFDANLSKKELLALIARQIDEMFDD